MTNIKLSENIILDIQESSFRGMKFTIGYLQFDIRLCGERCEEKRAAMTLSISFVKKDKFEIGW